MASRSREAFVAAMAKITNGMPKKEVITILGNPDDVRTETDPNGSSGEEVLCYGTSEHMGLPTLGYISMDNTGRVREIYGGAGHPPEPGMFKEEELRNLLRVLDTVPSLDGLSYDPLAIVRIVNTLSPSEKKRLWLP